MVIAITIIYWVPEIDLCPSAMDLDTLPPASLSLFLSHHIRMPTCLPKIDSFPTSSAAPSGHGIELLKHGPVPLGKGISHPMGRWCQQEGGFGFPVFLSIDET